MPEHHEDRRWERKEDLVMQALQDLRLSSDAALKGVNDLKIELIKVEGRMKQAEAETEDIKKRLDRANGWLMGILASLLLAGVNWAWGVLQGVSKLG